MRDIFDKNDAQLILLTTPDGDKNLITIDNQINITESLNLL